MWGASEYFAANPELKNVDLFAIQADEVAIDSAFYAANPELMAADRYVAPVTEHEETTGSTFIAANPELMAARRYTPAVKADPASPHVDPLQRIVRCCYGLGTGREVPVDASFLAANPELMIAGRYGAREKVTAPDFQLENRGLIETRRYTILLENGPILIRVNPK